MISERTARRRSREAVKISFSRSSSAFTPLFIAVARGARQGRPGHHIQLFASPASAKDVNLIAAFGQFALRFNAKLSGDTGVVVCMKQKDINLAPGGLCRHL